MAWSIRTRLSASYAAVVLAVLGAGATTAFVVHRDLTTGRMDEELSRQIATLEGVMRTEFGEGLDLSAAVAEARIEVVAPGRTLALSSERRQPLATWGVDVSTPLITTDSPDGHRTVRTNTTELRILQHSVAASGHQYVAAVAAPLNEVERDNHALLLAQLAGALSAAVVATLGGLVVVHRTLRPVKSMAQAASSMAAPTPTGRLEVPHPDDELGQLATAFNGVLDRLGLALDAQRQFMADASHQLRTPVSVVRATAQVALARDDRAAADYRRSLEVVAEEAARITRLVDDLFLLARGDASGSPLRRESFYLDDVIAAAVRGLRQIGTESDVQIVSTGATELHIEGDPALLRRALDNLLDNGVRHARRPGTVRIELRQTPDDAVVIVADDGPGVAPENRGRIFERFVRGDTRTDGAGLGLAIARWVAQAHGGALTLAESAGATSEFIMRLPLRPHEDANPPPI